MNIIWKRFYFARRHAFLSRAEFPARWRRHSELGATFPDGLRRHPRINYALVQTMHGASAAKSFDGIGILWLASPEHLDRVNEDPRCTPSMRSDELLVFQQPVYDSAMVVRERVSKEGPLTSWALLRFFRRAEGISDVNFADACETVGRVLSQSPEFSGVVRRFAFGTTVRPPTITFDGFMEFWFDTPETLNAAWNSDAFKRAALQPLDFAAGGNGEESTDLDVCYIVEICHERLSVADRSPTA